MTTIPQRLREIARSIDEMEHGSPDDLSCSLRFIAAELESAPAADAAPVVAWEYARRYGSGVSFARPDDYTDEDGYLVTPTALIRQRDHLATVAALQSRITSLEADLQFRREFQNGAEALAGKYLTQRDDARDRIASLAGENFALAAGQCIVPGGLCGDESGNQYCSLQARINALEARQVPESAKDLRIVVWPNGATFTAGSLIQAQDYMDEAIPSCIERGDAPPAIVRYVPAETLPYDPQPDTTKEQP